MEKRAFELKANSNGAVTVTVIPGHFATKHSHVNYCVDMTKIKSQMRMAKTTARMFAEHYCNTPIDTIISLERMKMVGAFLASELSHSGINLHQDIAVISPEITDDKMILRDNFLPYIKDQRVLLLTASASTGMTVNAAVEGIRYYGGEAVGAATVFGAAFKGVDVPVVKLFSADDLLNYASYAPVSCPLCKSGVKTDAVVNSYGYSKIITR
ncbi:MAG: orotate phosphoribosyltransferase [Clostridia bacterium]|jgi:orotate phosphoribosyltransferase|nr:orotate phosphoribosyltransferase [Clostridia bacterium]